MCNFGTESTRCLSLYGVRKYKVQVTLRLLALFISVTSFNRLSYSISVRWQECSGSLSRHHLLLWGSLQKELHFENGLDAQTSGEENNMDKTTNNTFAGCTIVATGNLENFTRNGINAKIISLGATPGSSVTKKTDYLICGEKAGSKLAKAEQLGVKILTEQEFLNMLSA